MIKWTTEKNNRADISDVLTGARCETNAIIQGTHISIVMSVEYFKAVLFGNDYLLVNIELTRYDQSEKLGMLSTPTKKIWNLGPINIVYTNNKKMPRYENGIRVFRMRFVVPIISEYQDIINEIGVAQDGCIEFSGENNEITVTRILLLITSMIAQRCLQY